MDDQKIENLLNLSLEATPEERERSLVLEEGYRPDRRLWELIVKYSGDFGRAAALAERVSYLLNEYAIVWIEEDRIQDFAGLPEVEYIEKPKRLFFADQQARAASCLLPVQREPLSLFGTGVLVAVIDSGADIFNRDFRNADGTTRIRALWDQTAPDAPEESDPQPFGEEELAPVSLGRVYGAAQINEFLQRASGRADGFVPGEDRSGHGTAVLGIAAGNGANSDGRNRGVAPESQLLVVKLGTPDPEGFPRTTQLIQGVDFAVRQALLWKMPVAVNVSFGNSYGPHDGTSLTERFLDDLSNYWKSVLVIGSGNEGAAGGHTGFTAVTGGRESVRLAVGSYEPGLNVQIWKQYVDDLSVVLVHPSGTEYQVPVNASGAHRVRMGGTELLLYVGEPGPYSTDQELFFDFLPLTDYVDPGEWRFDFTGNRVVSGNVNLWLPGGNVLGRATRFLEPAARLTLTIPSTAERVITAGAYDSRRDTLADFSGRGSFSLGKPDLAAPGVDIAAPTPGNGYGLFSGTSMAAPFVTGSAALLMEWGILRGNDPYLYGEKVKAYLQKGARQLPFAEEYPNPQVGYGALCVADSLPV